MTSRGAVPGSAVVKQEENISREVSQGPRKREEQHTGPLFPSMQRRSEKEGVPPPTPPPRQPVLSDESPCASDSCENESESNRLM